MSNVPDFEGMTRRLFNRTLKDKGVAGIAELREAWIGSDVKLVACRMTVDLFGYQRENLIPEIQDWIGATSFLPVAAKADVGLFV